MPQRDQHHVRRRRGRLVVALVTTLAMQATVLGVAWWQGDLDRLLGTEPVTLTPVIDVPATDVPATDAPVPDGSTLPEARSRLPVLEAPAGPRIDAEALEARVDPLLAAPRFGARIGFAVHDLTHDAPVLRSGPGAYMPASTLKLMTAAAVLEQLGPDHRFSTRVTLDAGTPDAGAPTVTLVGGGDPLLADGDDPGAYPQPVTLRDLVTPTVTVLRAEGTRRVRVGYDDSLFTGPPASPTWEEQYVPGVTSPVSALWFDEGIDPDTGLRASDPAALAGQQFAQALEARGIRVVGDPARTPAGSTELVSLDGPTLEATVGSVLGSSDNEGAEVLLRQLAIAGGQPASFAGGTRAMRTVLTGLGVSWRGVEVYDGSGLSRANAVPLTTLLDVLRLGADDGLPQLRSVLAELPVAGFDGSLVDRYAAPGTLAGRGLVRAKTGTLSGTHGLAGVVVDTDGVQLAFVALANGVAERNTLFARDQLDRVSTALATCGCSRAG